MRIRNCDFSEVNDETGKFGFEYLNNNEVKSMFDTEKD